MKATTEKMVEQSIKSLIATAERYRNDTSTVLGYYEGAHDEAECCNSTKYNALVAAHNALIEMKETLTNSIA